MAKPLRKRLLAQGIAPKRDRLDLDLAYEGQSSVITLRSRTSVRRLFEKKHKERYGISHKGRPVGPVALHAAALGTPASALPPSPDSDPAPPRPLRGA